MPDTRSQRTGVLAAVLAAVLFGAAYPLTAVGLRSFEPLALAALQGTFALIVILLLVGARILPPPRLQPMTAARVIRLGAVGFVGGSAFIAGMTIAVGLAGSTIASFVSTLYALFATLFAIPLLGERVRPVTVAALLLALLGTAMLAGFDPLGASVLGIAAALGAAVAFALYLVLARRWSGPFQLDATLIVLAVLIGRGPVLLAVELIREPARIVPAAPDPAAIIAIALLAIGPSTTAQLAVMASVRRITARRTSAALLLTPLVSAGIAATLLGERLVPLEIVGAALVFAGIAGASGVIDLLAARVRPPRQSADPAASVPD